MMAEYIERQKLLDSIIDRLGIKSEKDLLPAERVLYDEVENAPAADVVERKNGKWIWDDEGFHCSECLFHANGNTGEVLSGVYKYCPLCGSELEVET